MSKIREELENLVGLTQNKKESDTYYVIRLINTVAAVEDKDFDKLDKETQKFADMAVQVINHNAENKDDLKEIPLFPNGTKKETTNIGKEKKKVEKKVVSKKVVKKIEKKVVSKKVVKKIEKKVVSKKVVKKILNNGSIFTLGIKGKKLNNKIIDKLKCSSQEKGILNLFISKKTYTFTLKDIDVELKKYIVTKQDCWKVFLFYKNKLINNGFLHEKK